MRQVGPDDARRQHLPRSHDPAATSIRRFRVAAFADSVRGAEEALSISAPPANSKFPRGSGQKSRMNMAAEGFAATVQWTSTFGAHDHRSIADGRWTGSVYEGFISRQTLKNLPRRPERSAGGHPLRAVSDWPGTPPAAMCASPQRQASKGGATSPPLRTACECEGFYELPMQPGLTVIQGLPPHKGNPPLGRVEACHQAAGNSASPRHRATAIGRDTRVRRAALPLSRPPPWKPA